MNNNVSDVKVASSMIWRLAEKWGCQIVSFVVSVIIARILDPDAYGIIAIVNAFIAIFAVFVDSGLGNSLIQKKDSDDLDFSTVFYTNLALCVTVYLILFLCAPIIANFYKMRSLTALIRVSGITLIVSAIKNVQHAYIAKNLMFKKFFYASLGGTIGAAVLGIYMAISGYGVWALVASDLFDTIVDTLVMWLSIKWRPKFVFSFERLQGLFKYGWKILASSLLDTLYSKVYQLTIGKKYTSEDLAFYDKGDGVTNKITKNIDHVVNSVLFPVMSNVQDNIINVKKITQRSIKVNFYIMTPLLFGLFAIAEPVVCLLFTDKWLPAVPFIRIYCIINVFRPIHTINLNVIKSMGRSDIFLKQEIIKKVAGLLILSLTIKHGTLTMAYGLLISDFISQIINSWPNSKIINYSYIEQIKDILPTLLIGAIMATIVYIVKLSSLSLFLQILLRVAIGAIIYIGISIITKNESLYYIRDLMMKMLRKQ